MEWLSLEVSTTSEGLFGNWSATCLQPVTDQLQKLVETFLQPLRLKPFDMIVFHKNILLLACKL